MSGSASGGDLASAASDPLPPGSPHAASLDASALGEPARSQATSTSRARGATGLRIAGLLVLIAAAVALVSQLLPGNREEPLPVISELPDFHLTEASGRAVSRTDLLGRPWVADLVFTTCAGICPTMSQEMARLQKQTQDLSAVRLVSISVDPERDTPAQLTEYAARFGADRSRWLFLTGDGADIRKLANEGLRLTVADGDRAQGDEPVVHSPRFALIDSRAQVRGSYDVRDGEAMLRLRGDLRRLIDEEASAKSP